MKAKCLNPNVAWICGVVRCKFDGVLSPHIVFSPREAEEYYRRIAGEGALSLMERNQISVPCGKCAACEIRKRKDWTTRLSHESSMYEGNCCFITLTYDDDNIPVTCFGKVNGDQPKMLDRGLGELPLSTLLLADVQKFIKRLRRHLEYAPKKPSTRFRRDHVDTPIRYYAVGEYGGRTGRPHYHLMIFGWCPSDMEIHSKRNGHIVYRSAQIEKLWKYGFSTVEPVQGGVAKYCSRYVTKKFARLKSEDPFADSVIPEFVLQSVRNGGIGSSWFDKNYLGMFDRGYANIKCGKDFIKASIPAYYWRRCRRKHLELWLILRDERLLFARSDTRGLYGYDDLVRSCQVYEDRERQSILYELF